MAYEPLTTTGGNGHLGGNGTFPQLVDGLAWIAQNRDQVDVEQRAAWETAANTAENNAKAHADTQDDAHSAADRAYTDQAEADAIAAALTHWGDVSGRVWNDHLDTLSSRGVWQSPGTGMTTNGWPTTARSVVMVMTYGEATDYVIQVVIPRLEGAWNWRSKHGTTWSPWVQINPAGQPATGWVDISSGIGAGVTATGLRVYREGNTVWCTGQGVTASTTGTTSVVAIPAGYQPATMPSGMSYRHEPAYTDDGASTRPTSYYNGNLRIINAQAGVAYNFTVSWPTTNAKL